ncbi:MAG: DUF3084 domain-containing protein [Aphanocapsa feldmannii 277cV]|uniref:DUF3084 domain-containing protein n=2 Tax=Aphanocapsa feldmannii TaxID=192050 RepID=A0A524RPF8_9CHRO|nr:MAG: DUF3084 domain-containing protein [Aphanocapsa feldmannii 277cV]TGH19790.1 MAG: DUF3084 domain-containing protein [Aphanocapsa feldmannii 277cI]
MLSASGEGTLSGWLLIFALLVLGGVLATLGDHLGSKVGRARLRLLGLRPKRTAVLITVATGSLISALSFGLLIGVNRQWRRGLFELGKIEASLRSNRKDLEAAQQRSRELEDRTANLDASVESLSSSRSQLLSELDVLQRQIDRQQEALQRLQSSVLAFRRGEVAITTAAPLAVARLVRQDGSKIERSIEQLLNQANRTVYARVLPDEDPSRQLLQVPISEVEKLRNALQTQDDLVVIVRSAANVLMGEQRVLAFIDLRPNRLVVRRDQVLATMVIEASDRSADGVREALNLLVASARSELQSQGALEEAIQLDRNAMATLSEELAQGQRWDRAVIEVVARDDARTANPVILSLRWVDRPETGDAP